MKTAKSAVVFFVALVVVVVGAWAAITALTGEGETRYVRVDSACVQASQDADMPFEYRLTAFDENARKTEVSFKTVRELRDGALLSLKVLPVRGVVSWEEVAVEDVPASVASALDAA